MSNAIDDVLAERERQKKVEGWSEAHDDHHTDRSLARAALCYVTHYIDRSWLMKTLQSGQKEYQAGLIPDEWPESWGDKSWKPKDPRRDLVRAAALLIAEIEVMDRQDAREHESVKQQES